MYCISPNYGAQRDHVFKLEQFIEGVCFWGDYSVYYVVRMRQGSVNKKKNIYEMYERIKVIT